MKKFGFSILTLAALAGAAVAIAQPTEKSVAPSTAQPAKAPAAAPPAGWVPANQIGYVAEDVVTNVQVPWAIAFDPAGRMFFTERAGRVRVYEKGKLQEEAYFTVPNVFVSSETGLMGMAFHPDYAKNKFLYLAYGFEDKESKVRDIRIVRFKDSGSTLVEDKVILAGLPVRGNHSGCCIHFGPDGKLYISTGETFKKELAQDMTSLGGKFLRLNDDGTIPSDNPFVGKEGNRPEIWAFGVRNPQGFDWQPGTNMIFETEHGPSGEGGIGDQRSDGDEFNSIEKGKNYGWPVIHHDLKHEGMESPLINWSNPGMAPGGGCFVKGDLFPALKGNYLVGCLKGSQLRRITLDGSKVVKDETFITKYGRIRAIAEGPDGAIYFSTSNKDGRGQGKPTDDRIVRLTPPK